MFRCLERSWLAREVRLKRDDLADAEQVTRALQAAAQTSEDTPLRRLAQMTALSHRETARPAGPGGDSVDRVLEWAVGCDESTRTLPAIRCSPDCHTPDPDVEPLLADARQGYEFEAGERLWLNRQLVDVAFRQATGKACFRSIKVCFDAVLVSDSGKRFQINNARSGGLINRSMRATDIVMDRVWQLGRRIPSAEHPVLSLLRYRGLSRRTRTRRQFIPNCSGWRLTYEPTSIGLRLWKSAR